MKHSCIDEDDGNLTSSEMVDSRASFSEEESANESCLHVHFLIVASE